MPHSREQKRERARAWYAYARANGFCLWCQWRRVKRVPGKSLCARHLGDLAFYTRLRYRGTAAAELKIAHGR